MMKRYGMCVVLFSLTVSVVQGEDVSDGFWPRRSSVATRPAPVVNSVPSEKVSSVDEPVLLAEPPQNTTENQERDATIRSLAERLEVLESRQKTLEVPPLAVLQADAKGYALKSSDGNFLMKIKGDIHADGRFYLGDDGHRLMDQFLLRRVRPALDVLLSGKFHGRIQLNLITSAPTQLDDAYFEWLTSPLCSLRFGRFKPEVGLENLQPSGVLSFIERSLASNLVPVYDTGAGVYGVLGNGRLPYSLTYGNGAVDGGTGDTETTDRKEVNGRLFVLPFKRGSRDFLKDLGVGLGASRGGGEGASCLPARYNSQGMNQFFVYNGNTVANGTRTRWSPQFYWYPGPVSVMAEYVASAQKVKTTAGAKDNLTHRAWQVSASWVLTGDKTSFDGVKIKQNFDPKAGTWGVWEIAGRYSQLTVDNDAFAFFADPFLSARMSRAWTGGLNWYLNPAFKFQTNYSYNSFDGGAGTVQDQQDRKTERSLFTRVVFAF